MLFGKKICSKCGSNYDIVESTCPVCHERDENFESLGIPKQIIWLPFYKQLLLFIIGFIGLNILGIIAELFAIPFKDNFSEVGLTMFMNTFRYVGVAMGMGFLIWNHWPRFKEHFNRAFPYLIGLAGGAAVIGAQVFINMITNAIYPTSVNENQTLVNSVIDAFPVLSIFLLGIIGPVVEEFTYRLGLFSFLARSKKWIAYLVTTIVFAFIHFNFFAGNLDAYIVELVNLPSYIVAGFLFCLWYDKFGLASSITAHCVNNLYSILMFFVLKLIN